MPSNRLILCHPLLLLRCLSQIRVFADESTFGIRWKNYWSFSFSISPSNEYLVLISFRIYWFDLLAVQETLKSLLQHHSLKASIFNLSALLMVQLSHPYMATRKTIALTSWIFVGNIMSLLFNILFRFIIAFLPRKKYLLILCLQSPTTAILEPRKMKSVTVSSFPLSTCHEVMGSGAWSKFFWMLSFKPAFSLSSFTFIKGLFSSSSLSAINVVLSAYLRLLFLLAILIPACASAIPIFHMMYSAYKLNKQGDNIQPWCTPFPILNQPIVPRPFLIVSSQPAYRFLRRQVT